MGDEMFLAQFEKLMSSTATAASDMTELYAAFDLAYSHLERLEERRGARSGRSNRFVIKEEPDFIWESGSEREPE